MERPSGISDAEAIARAMIRRGILNATLEAAGLATRPVTVEEAAQVAEQGEEFRGMVEGLLDEMLIRIPTGRTHRLPRGSS